jgi:hypothetical protein
MSELQLVPNTLVQSVKWHSEEMAQRAVQVPPPSVQRKFILRVKYSPPTHRGQAPVLTVWGVKVDRVGKSENLSSTLLAKPDKNTFKEAKKKT